MKKVFIAILMAGAVPAMAQKMSAGKVPAPASSAFEKMHPGIADVKWEKEKGNFEANFTEGNTKITAVYNDKGELMETEYAMDMNRMQPTITKYVQEHFAGAKIKEFNRVDKPGSPANYEVIVGSKELTFGPNGQFIKEEAAQ